MLQFTSIYQAATLLNYFKSSDDNQIQISIFWEIPMFQNPSSFKTFELWKHHPSLMFFVSLHWCCFISARIYCSPLSVSALPLDQTRCCFPSPTQLILIFLVKPLAGRHWTLILGKLICKRLRIFTAVELYPQDPQYSISMDLGILWWLNQYFLMIKKESYLF